MEAINLRPQTAKLAARELPQLIELYLEESAGRVQPHTLEGYTFKLQYFIDWWTEAGPSYGWTLTPGALLAFREWLDGYRSERTGKRLSYNSKRDALRRLGACLSWAYREGYVATDWSVRVPSVPNGREPSYTPFSMPELRRVLYRLGDAPTFERDMMLFVLLAGTGMRRAECAALQVEDLRFFGNHSGFCTIKNAKGKKERRACFDSECGKQLAKYVAALSRSSGPLWPNERRPEEAITPRHINRLFSSAARRAGVVGFGPHDLRRGFATAWTRRLRSTPHAQLLSKQLGHNMPGITWRYSLSDWNDVLACMESTRVSLYCQMLDHGKGG